MKVSAMTSEQIVGYLVTVVVAILGSSWVGDWLKARRERKSGMVTTNQILDAVKSLRADFDEEKAIQARVRIVKFNDEILTDQRHSKESFDQVLSDIDTYDRYCSEHPQFVNSKTKLSSENIRRTYQECESKHSFL
ncbi:MAG: hypothetical protein IJ907_01810 [Prevotella sp.]|nr:hypothetical protein [Prevotella sp.]